MKYDIIYADCPWEYNSRANHKTRFRGGACGHYDLLSVAELKELPIADIAEDNCALFQWVTMPMLKEGIEVLESWGFRYVTCAFTWIKTNKKNTKPFFGVGYYTKSNAELCLLGIKGKMKPVSNCVSSAVIAPLGLHSEKPLVVKERIEELYGFGKKRIELFSRQETNGWDCVGNGIDGIDIREAIEEVKER